MVKHKVLPRLTGLAQVNGCRGETADLPELKARINYDLDYLRRWSPLLDIKILFLTVRTMFRDEKAY
jgi:putative colanic acid biosynthesis UDP-glucose lipid carrier transferase